MKDNSKSKKKKIEQIAKYFGNGTHTQSTSTRIHSNKSMCGCIVLHSAYVYTITEHKYRPYRIVRNFALRVSSVSKFYHGQS